VAKVTNQIAIVVPMYNEENRFDVAAFSGFLDRNHHFVFIFVNDGSSDNTLALIKVFQQKHPRQSLVVSLPKNQGKAEAVRQGLLTSIDQKFEFCGYLDADLATPLEEVETMFVMLQSLPNIKLMLGSRVKLMGRRVIRNPYRHYLGRVFATFASLVLNLPIYDTQCGAKLIQIDEKTNQVLAESFDSRWIFDVELIARMIKVYGQDVKDSLFYEFPLNQWIDIAGSKVKPHHFMIAIKDLIRIHWHYRHFLRGKRLDP
jgi:glycosyltransferase involved in cell wall biosynthesis